MSKLPSRLLRIVAFCACALGFSHDAWAQPTGTSSVISYDTPREYVVGGIEIRGSRYSDINTIRLFSGLQVGDKVTVPGDRLSEAIRNLWKQELFTDISISATSIEGENIYLVIELTEVPRLSKWDFRGLTRGEQETMNDKLKLIRGGVVTENAVSNSKRIIKNHFLDKGFYNVDVEAYETADTKLANSSILTFEVNKGVKVKVEDIRFTGNETMPEEKLLRTMKNTKEKRWWRIFKSSKLIETEYLEDKQALVALYNKNGYRDARILRDSIYRNADGTIGLDIHVNEGNQFFFRDIDFTGNTKYSTDTLRSLLGVSRGDVYNTELLNTRLYANQKGLDINTLYMDDGYLTFNVYPVETQVENDSIDIEIRMLEGKQFRIGKVVVNGNSKTNDHVIYREVRTLPGDLFSRTNIMRTQRELAQLGYFNPESFNVNPIQHPEDGTVDLEYVVEEKPSDQIELSGGWGGGRIVGTLGLRFTNFSARNMFKKGQWRPVPTGDGQQLSIRAQTNGAFYQALSLSFVEPWLGGKKPNTFSVSLSRSRQTNGQKRFVDDQPNPALNAIVITGGSVGYGKRLTKPDDWFSVFFNASYQHFKLQNSPALFSFTNGESNNFSFGATIQRNSVNDPIFPTSGSTIKLSVKATPPYSAMGLTHNDDWSTASDQEKFRWVEYHKWKFTADWYTPLTRGGKENKNKLVLRTNVGFGILGSYNSEIGLSPFERFYLGGVFLSGYVLDGREIINLRGYDDLSLSATNGAPVINKFSAELRYPLSTNPSATVFMLGFAEAGNTWNNLSDFNPFELKRSAGVGLRIFLPMFGMLGLDYGWRFDDGLNPNAARGQFHFSIGAQVGDL